MWERWCYIEHHSGGLVSKFWGLLQVRSPWEMAEKGLAWKTLKNTLGLQTTYSHISHPPQHPTAGCAELSRVVTSLQQHLQISVQSCVAPGKDRVTGQSVGSGASLWHQNAPSINSNHSLASICKLFFFFPNLPLFFLFLPPSFIKKCVYVWREIFNRMLENRSRNFRKEKQLEDYIWSFNWGEKGEMKRC